MLTQEQAGFDANHLLRYNANSFIVTVDDNGTGAVDILNGPMALRPGDPLLRGDSALEVLSFVDATHFLALFV